MDDSEITAQEAATILKCTPHHVRWYYRKGYLSGRKIGGQLYVFPRDAVVELSKNKPPTGRPPAKGNGKSPAKKRKGKGA